MATVHEPVAHQPQTHNSIKRERRLLTASCLSTLLLLVLWLLEEFVGERTNPTTILLYLPQHAFGLWPLWLCLCSLRRRQWLPAFINTGALTFFLFVLLGLNIPTNRSGGTGRHLRVMTYNIQFCSYGTAHVAKAIQSQHPDIVCLQETTPDLEIPDPHDHTAELLTYFPGWHHIRRGDVTILTRFPILIHREHTMPRPNVRVLLEAELQTPEGRFTVFNAHIGTAPPGVDPTWVNTLWGHIWSVLTRTHKTAKARARQLPIIDAATARCQTPYIMTGDFNNPPRGYFYRHLSTNFQDAFKAAGSGLGQSYPARFPMMRIDYIWLGRGTRVQDCFVPRLYASDHRPMVADIEVTAGRIEG
jgi:vancomycin resistance protein VanJ